LNLKYHVAALGAFLLHGAAVADDYVLLQRVQIEGSRTSQLGLADSAADGSVSQQQLEARTVYRPGELLEAVPGLVVSQHSGEGKANQFYLRGFNLDHGTDLRSIVDDMPVNQRTHAHGQGWTDLNFLIPELSARLDYKKGPYSAENGDFASAGTVSVVYANRLTQGIASVGIGQNGYARSLVADSLDVGKGSLLYALEVQHSDGPFTDPDNYHKLNGVLRYSEGYANNGFNVTLMGYNANWNSTDQIPLRAVDDGQIGRFDAIDPTDGGKSHRYSLSGTWRQTTQDSSSKINGYIIANRLDLFSDFTYFLDDPVNGDQFEQPDRRVTTGIEASHTWHRHTDEGTSDTTLGMQTQNDNIFNGLYSTRARQVLSVTRQDHIVESSAALYLENNSRWTSWLRTTAGARTDFYRANVRSDLAANSGTVDEHMTSPSLGVVVGPWAYTELYVNAGDGFHSNDARGATIAVDPKTLLPTDKVPLLVRSRGIDLGVRSEYIKGLQSSLSLYRLDFDSELTFDGDAGTTEAGRPSRRYGIEFSNYYKPAKWLSIDADLAYAKARFRDFNPIGNYIPGAVEGVGQLALTVTPDGPYSGALKLRFFGPRPLIADNSVRSKKSMTLNGRFGYRIDRTTRIELEAFNLTNRADSAIDYYYQSRLPGEAAAGVNDIHFHPIESRSLRLTLVKNF
jgi:outer membrane receptor for Fe3+-dicitrate